MNVEKILSGLNILNILLYIFGVTSIVTPKTQSSIVYEPMAWWTLHGGLNGLVEHNKPDVVVDQIRFSVWPRFIDFCVM